MPAPTKFTDANRKIILDKIEKGLSRESAAAAAKVTTRTIRNWLERGRKGELGFVQFLNDVELAEHKAEGVYVNYVLQAAKKDWRAAAWWLARRFPQRWSENRIAEEQMKVFVAALRETLPEPEFNKTMQLVTELQNAA